MDWKKAGTSGVQQGHGDRLESGGRTQGGGGEPDDDDSLPTGLQGYGTSVGITIIDIWKFVLCNLQIFS